MAIFNRIADFQADLTATRRDIHAHPELGFQEHRTSDLVAQQLEAMGITSFRQVARFTAEDVEAVNAAIEAFPGRVERDDWVGSARRLHREVYGVDP